MVPPRGLFRASHRHTLGTPGTLPPEKNNYNLKNIKAAKQAPQLVLDATLTNAADMDVSAVPRPVSRRASQAIARLLFAT